MSSIPVFEGTNYEHRMNKCDLAPGTYNQICCTHGRCQLPLLAHVRFYKLMNHKYKRAFCKE